MKSNDDSILEVALIVVLIILVVILISDNKRPDDWRPSPPPPRPQSILVIPAYPVPPVQATPWPQVFFPDPPQTIIDTRQLTVQQQLQLQRQLQEQWVYDPIQRKVVRRTGELAPTNP